VSEPYLLVGIRMANDEQASKDNLRQIIRDVEGVLRPRPFTELKVPDVYVVVLTQSSAFDAWRKVSMVLAEWDIKLGDELQWFANLSDRRGCEIAFN
jgi:hypothetical protein